MTGIALGLFTLFCVVLGVLLYFLPVILAKNGGHKHTTAIGALNLLLGWTILGWIGALIWALTSPTHTNTSHPSGIRLPRSCPGCGLDNPAETKFCAGCGRQLA